MATKNFTFRISASDSDGNTDTERVVVNVGPSSATEPDVVFNFPSEVRVEPGDDVDPYWSSAENLATAFCKVFPEPRYENGSTGRFLCQYYYTSGNYPNDPNRRFNLTFEGVGGQLSADLGESVTEFMEVTSGTGVAGTGLCQQTDISGFRKAIHITDNSQISAGSRVVVGGRTFTIPSQVVVNSDDEVIAAYHHDLTTDKVYTLQRGSRGGGRPRGDRATSTKVQLHPYHYAPLYQNDTASPLNVMPYVMVAEEGTQYTLTGSFGVSGTTVTGTNSDLLNEISGTNNIIKFGDNENWFLVSGTVSSSGLVLYDYGDNPQLSNQVAQVNAFALGSGLITVSPDLTGCENWNVRISPVYENNTAVSNLAIQYTAEIEEVRTGGAISGTPGYEWQEYSGGSWSALSPGNLSTQTVTYTDGTAKRIRVQVSGSGQEACVHTDDTGNLTLAQGTSAGTWVCIPDGTTNTSSKASINKFTGLNPRVSGLYYNHNLYVIDPKKTKNTGSVLGTPTSVSVTPGTIDSWPSEGTVLIIKDSTNPPQTVKKNYKRLVYTGKTNSALTGCRWIDDWTQNGFRNDPFNRSTNPTAAGTFEATSDMWIPFQNHMPWTFVVSRISNIKIKVQDARAFLARNPAARWVRFGNPPGGDSYNLTMTARYSIASINTSTNEIIFNEQIPTQLTRGSTVYTATWEDESGVISDGTIRNWNRWRTVSWLNYPEGTAPVSLSSSAGTDLKIRDEAYQHFTRYDAHSKSWRLNPIGRMVVPDIDGNHVVISYKGYLQAPKIDVGGFSTYSSSQQDAIVSDMQPDGIMLWGARIDAALSDTTSFDLPPGVLMLPFWEADIKPFANVSIPPTDDTHTFTYNSNTDYHGDGRQVIDVVFASTSEIVNSTNFPNTSIPATPKWEDLLQGFPTGGVVGHGPLYIKNLPEGEFTPIVSCLHADTEISMGDGSSKEIIDVVPGDIVKTPNGSGKVFGIKQTETSEYFVLRLSGGEIIHCTGEHPFAITDGDVSEYRYLPASQIKTGMLLVGENAETVSILIAAKIRSTKTAQFFDIEVESEEYYANGVLVHNKTLRPIFIDPVYEL